MQARFLPNIYYSNIIDPNELAMLIAEFDPNTYRPKFQPVFQPGVIRPVNLSQKFWECFLDYSQIFLDFLLFKSRKRSYEEVSCMVFFAFIVY